jgi:hypothetical protein
MMTMVLPLLNFLFVDRTTTRPAAKMDEFALSWFFGLGLFSNGDLVWEESFVHTLLC